MAEKTNTVGVLDIDGEKIIFRIDNDRKEIVLTFFRSKLYRNFIMWIANTLADKFNLGQYDVFAKMA